MVQGRRTPVQARPGSECGMAESVVRPLPRIRGAPMAGRTESHAHKPVGLLLGHMKIHLAQGPPVQARGGKVTLDLSGEQLTA